MHKILFAASNVPAKDLGSLGGTIFKVHLWGNRQNASTKTEDTLSCAESVTQMNVTIEVSSTVLAF